MANLILSNQTSDTDVQFSLVGQDHYIQADGVFNGATVSIQVSLGGLGWVQVDSFAAPGIKRVIMPTNGDKRISVTGSGASTSISVAYESDNTRVLG